MSRLSPSLSTLDKVSEPDGAIEATHYIDQHVGRRYAECSFDNFETGPKEQAKKVVALQACAEYAINFRDHFNAGRSLILVGPKGTGKDHLLTATIRRIARNFGKPGKVMFRDGLKLFSEFRAAFNTETTEQAIVEKYISPALLAISDPLPPRGTLSEHEQRMALRIIDGRYRESRPLALTINAVNRQEISDRMGVQACDRIFDCAVVVRCVWESYRTEQTF
jgi:DNA replication protein DnaC